LLSFGEVATQRFPIALIQPRGERLRKRAIMANSYLQAAKMATYLVSDTSQEILCYLCDELNSKWNDKPVGILLRSRAIIAFRCRCSPKVVSKAIKELTDAGVMKIKKRGPKCHLYIIFKEKLQAARAEWREEDRGFQQKLDQIEDAFSRRYGNLTPEELYEAELEFEADDIEEGGDGMPEMKLPLVTTPTENRPKGNFISARKVTTRRPNSNYKNPVFSSGEADSVVLTEKEQKVSRSLSLGLVVAGGSLTLTKTDLSGGGFAVSTGVSKSVASLQPHNPTSQKHKPLPQAKAASASSAVKEPHLESSAAAPASGTQRVCAMCGKVYHAPFGGRVCDGCEF
jgi:hypothetical protein